MAFQQSKKLFDKSGVPKKKFQTELLEQVGRDTSIISDSSSGYRFVAITRALSDGIGDGSLSDYVSNIVSLVEKYPDLSELAERASFFEEDPSRIFDSWQRLQQFYDLTQVGKRGVLLERMNSMRSSGDPKLIKRAQWFERVAFDPESKIAFEDVICLMERPGEFLDRDEDPGFQHYHEPKKPIHMTKIPFHDLSPEQLVECMLDGVLDELQSLPACEMVYRIPSSGEGIASVREALKHAIKREPHLERQRFGKARSFLREHGVNMKQYLAGEVNLLPGQEELLLDFIYSEDMGFSEEMAEVKVSIARKSDPRAHVAGNRTKSCMAFGVGKQIVYSFHLGCAHLIVEINRHGTTSTLAQSVMSEDRDIRVPIPKLHKAVRSATSKGGSDRFQLGEILPEEVLDGDRSIIAADNREVPKNRQTAASMGILNPIFADFLAEYVKRLPESWNVERDWVPVGVDYSYGMEGEFPLVNNTYAPVAPIGYSDKTGAKVYRIQSQRPRVGAIRELSYFDGDK